MNRKKILSRVISSAVFSMALTTATFVTFSQPGLADDFCTRQGMKTRAYGKTRRYEVFICKKDIYLQLYYSGESVDDPIDGYSYIASAYDNGLSKEYNFTNDFNRAIVTRKKFVFYAVSQRDEFSDRLLVNEKFRKFKQFR